MSDTIVVNKHTKELKKKRRLNAERLDREEEMLNRHDIMQAGQEDSHKGAQAVIEQQKREKREKDKIDADALTDLESKKRFQDGYNKSLASALGKLLENLDWILGWQAYCMATSGATISIKGKPFSTKLGVLLIVTTPDGRVMHQGLETLGDPVMDYSALYTIAAQVENTMDQERGLLLSAQKEDQDAAVDKILDSHGKPISAD